MNYSTVTAPSGDRVKDAEPVASFTAKLASAHATRLYRIYLRRADLFFIVLAEGLSASPETLTVHFGLLGALIGAMMKKRAKKKNAAATRRMDQADPEQLLAEHKHNFKLHNSEIREGSIEPRPWLTIESRQVGQWKLALRDDRKMKFHFENNEEMTAALDVLSKFLNGNLTVNVEWDGKKKRFKKKKA
jgi:hypothetical protein